MRSFAVEERERVRARVLALAESDPRVVAAAVVGGLAAGGGDRFSDLDLTFAVAEDASVDEVVADWTATVAAELQGVHLFDLTSGPTLYRVFLLPGCLQVDLSFTQAAGFGPRGPRFALLFGTVGEPPPPPAPPSEPHLFGLAVHHAVRARVAVERGRPWQAAHWIGALRDEALALACLRRGLESRHGRALDELPPAALEPFEGALVRSLEREELLRALRCAVDALLGETDAPAPWVETELRAL